MLKLSPLRTEVLCHLGPVPISVTVVTTWAIMAVLVLASWLGTRRMRVHHPGWWQGSLEVLVQTLMNQIRDVVRRDPRPFLPLVGTLFLFIVVANLSPLVPGVAAPTAHIETDAALAILVFLSVHAFGIRHRGLWGYLKSYAEPNVLMAPLNVLSEITRTFSLMVRLFGNIMSHAIVIAVVVALVGLLVPIPLMALAILIGVVQAYIFSVLAAVFVGAAVGASEEKRGASGSAGSARHEGTS